MKKLIALIMVLVLGCMICLAGCGKSDTETNDETLLTLSSMIGIIDRTRHEELYCVEVEEKFYEDDENEYYFSCVKSEYVLVCYADGSDEIVTEALAAGRITLSDLDDYAVDYIVKEK